MKILQLSPYYFPEQISSSHLTKDLEEAYVNAGFDITIYAPTPTRGITEDIYQKYRKISYEEFYHGKIKLNRFAMFREGKNPIGRAFRYVLVNIIQYMKGIHEKDVDVIVGASTPPTQGMLCALVKKKLSKKYGKPVKVVFSLQDVFPDSLVLTGLTKKGSFIWKIGRALEDYTYKNVDEIIVISEEIKENILAKGVPESKITVIRNWIDINVVRPISDQHNQLRTELKLTDGVFYVVYAGNIGKAQGIDMIVDAANQMKHEPTVKFLLFGNGAEEAVIKKKIIDLELDNIVLYPLQPADKVSEVYSLGDACIVACKKGSGKNAFPSKTVSIMATATPVIAAFDEDSELCNVLKQYHVGISCEPENVESLVNAINYLRVHKKESQIMGCNGRDLVEKQFSKELCTSKYVDVLKAYDI